MNNEKFPSIAYALALPLWSGNVKYGLELPEKLLAALGSPQDKLKVVHVAGTNGKGSTCALIAAMLYAEGHKVCQYLSPHLTNICERCVINGKPIEPEKFDRALERVRKVSAENGLEPSFFVYTHAATILCALEERVDYLVLEVGLGGRLDSTNVLKKPLATVITSVGLDHMNVLGATEYEIAREKAGIFKKGVPAFIGEVSEEARRGIEEVAREVGVECEFIGQKQKAGFGDQKAEVGNRRSDISHQTVAGGLQRAESRKQNLFPSQLELNRLQLKGEHQRNNAILAARVAAELGVSSTNINRGMEICRFPGRLESFEFEGKQVLLDIAHNAQGMEALAEYLLSEVGSSCTGGEILTTKDRERAEGECRIIFLISILDRKDPDAMLAILYERLKGCATFIFSQAKHPNALPAEVLAESLRKLCGGSEATPDSAAALDQALTMAGDRDIIVATGSLFFVAEIRKIICGEAFSSIVL